VCDGSRVSGRPFQRLGLLVVATMSAALASACGGGGSRPQLHRPVAAVWCRPVIAATEGDTLSARRGKWDARAIIGVSLDNASRLAERHQCQVRPVGGKDVPADAVITMDLIPNRINVDVTDGVVTALDTINGSPVG
jgi:hypothetical protein